MFNRVERKTLILILTAAVVLMTTEPAMADISLNVPVYLQTYSSWSSDKLGSTSYTIGNSGCAITCIAMVFKYYGVQTDPKDMNTWLKNNAGYDTGGNVYWSVAAARTGGSVKWIGKYDYRTIPADLNKIKTQLDKGYPVIAEVLNGGHFVVITGYSGSTFYINDPLNGAIKLSDRYNSDPAKAITGIRIYNPTIPST